MASLLLIPNDSLSHLYLDPGTPNKARSPLSLPRSLCQSPTLPSNTGDILFSLLPSQVRFLWCRHLDEGVFSALFILLGSVQVQLVCCPDNSAMAALNCLWHLLCCFYYIFSQHAAHSGRCLLTAHVLENWSLLAAWM